MGGMNHRDHHPWGSISFWKGNAACDKSEADRHRLEVGYEPKSISLDFLIDAIDQYRLIATIAALHSAFESGGWHARKEIRDALGITEPRS